jgi:hypothetical protein
LQKVPSGQPASVQVALSPSGVLQARASQVEPSGQKLPHWLQLLESVDVSTQVPPQHAPAWVVEISHAAPDTSGSQACFATHVP